MTETEQQQDVFNPPSTAPKDGSCILLNINYPWAVCGCWNECEKKWVYANMQLNMVDGKWNDPYFENDYAEDKELLGWLPVPEVPEKRK